MNIKVILCGYTLAMATLHAFGSNDDADCMGERQGAKLYLRAWTDTDDDETNTAASPRGRTYLSRSTDGQSLMLALEMEKKTKQIRNILAEIGLTDFIDLMNRVVAGEQTEGDANKAIDTLFMRMLDEKENPKKTQEHRDKINQCDTLLRRILELQKATKLNFLNLKDVPVLTSTESGED